MTNNDKQRQKTTTTRRRKTTKNDNQTTKNDKQRQPTDKKRQKTTDFVVWLGPVGPANEDVMCSWPVIQIKRRWQDRVE